MPDRLDPYKTLQVDPEAEDEVIQAAYRRLARKYHPDLAETAEAATRMAAINAAWELIGDPAARRAFDRERSTDPTSGAAPPGGPARPSPTTRASATPPPAPRSASGATAGEPEVVSPDWTSGKIGRASCRERVLTDV